MKRQTHDIGFDGGAAPVQGRPCDHPDCKGTGEFRAPRSRDDIGAYYWFCLDHVRAYNASWDYYAGMSTAQIEASLRQDTVWQRPTWRLGTLTTSNRLRHARVHDPFGFFDDDPLAEHRRAEPRRPPSPEEDAMRVMELQSPITVVALKARYKVLVKRHHPDANGGDKAAEERFKEINQAYKTLMNSLSA